MADSEYNECMQLAVGLGKSYKQAQKDWRDVNEMQPVWCEIITNYPCICYGLNELRTEVKSSES